MNLISWSGRQVEIILVEVMQQEGGGSFVVADTNNTPLVIAGGGVAQEILIHGLRLLLVRTECMERAKLVVQTVLVARESMEAAVVDFLLNGSGTQIGWKILPSRVNRRGFAVRWKRWWIWRRRGNSIISYDDGGGGGGTPEAEVQTR